MGSRERWLARQALRGLSVVVAGAGAFLLVTLAPGTRGADFLSHPQTKLWVIAIAVQAGLWAAVAPYLARCFWQFRPSDRRIFVALVVFALIIILVILSLLFWFRVSLSYPLAGHGPRIFTLTILGLLALSPGASAIWLMRQRLLAVNQREPSGWLDTAQRVKELLVMQDMLARVLLALGVAIGAATLATGALRNAVIAYRPMTASQFSATYPLLYGGLFTAVLAMIYFPTYDDLQRTSRRVVEIAYPVDWRDGPDHSWFEGRRDFVDLLKIERSPLQAFRSGVAILGPIIGSLLGLLLPGK